MPIDPPPVGKFSIDPNENSPLFEENKYGLSFSKKENGNIVKICEDNPPTVYCVGVMCCRGSGSSQVEKEEDIIL